MSLGDYLEFAYRTAVGRGRGHPAALPRADRRRGQGRRGGYDPVTAADREAEALIRASIAKRVSRPRHPRRGARLRARDSSYTWVIDPIDGTRSFILGQLHWGMLVALHDGERVVVRRHAPAVRRRDVSRVRRRTARLRRGRRAHARDAPLRRDRRCDPRDDDAGHVRQRAHAGRRSSACAPARGSRATAATATRTACSRWG